jgi:predicted glutamine amidotransferase
MCRVLGCVAADPVSLQHDLLEAPNPIVRQSEVHDSGWGMAVYRRAEGEGPACTRFPEAAFSGDELAAASEQRGRMFNVHVRRATVGGLAPENTHPFCLGSYSFSHNGTVIDYRKLLGPGVQEPHGSTDSEYLFNHIVCHFDEQRAIDSLRAAVETVIDRTPFSGINFVFCDGERLYAYRLGVFELHWTARPGQLLVASEPTSNAERWHSVQQDVLLVCDPRDPAEPHAERLVGDAVVARAHIDPFDEGSELTGRERGEFAARRAARLAGTTTA